MPSCATWSRRLHWAVHLIAAGLLLGAGFLVDALPDLNLFWSSARWPLWMAGAALLLLALVCPWPAVARGSARVCLAVITSLAAVGLLELGFRLAHFDFRAQEATWRRLPPFFRRPSVPLAGPFHRRPGPEEWTGQVIRTFARHERLPTAPYDDEPVVTVRYDRFGFRNEPRPPTWQIAVVGDSFTELGHLPFDQLFTTILGRRLDRTVLNLGVSYTGPLAYLSYLEAYGVCPELEAVVLVFYEGNDGDDVAREEAQRRQFEVTGRRENSGFHPQSSFLRALGEWQRRRKTGPFNTPPPIVAYFDAKSGRVPVTLGPAPPSPESLSPAARQALDRALDGYAAFGRSRQVQCWLAYMPCKRRVLHGRVQFTEAAPEAVRSWAPTELPQLIATECARRGVSFVDLTPRLIAETAQQGELLYNGRYDLHLNARGAAAVADELARRLRPGGG